MSTDKELYEKEKVEGWKNADNWCAKNVAAFLEARNKGDFETEFSIMCRKLKIICGEEHFVYFLDTNFRILSSPYNLTPNYEQILLKGFNDMYLSEDSIFGIRANQILWSIEEFIDRIIVTLKEEQPKNYEQKIKWFSNMRNGVPETFEEAIQRILFVNQLIWQSGSHLVGLGKLDDLLWSWYERDLKIGRLTREEASDILKDMCRQLHQYYWYKSSGLLGDTGQAIVVGGSDENGNYVYNDLTLLFIEVMKELQISEPKVILRVNKQIPYEIWQMALDCMKTGVGSPLIANDDVIIPRLIDFGIEPKDAYCYATSACWEPLIPGKSSSMNNEYSLCYMEVLYNLLTEEKLEQIHTFEELKKRFYFYLKREIQRIEKLLFQREYYRNTLYSLFMEGCKESGKDIIEGGAKYHNMGITTVSLGNTINALFNIEKYVFQEHRYSLVDVKKMCVLDYEGYPEALSIVRINDKQYGFDHSEVISLANEILRFVTKHTKDFRTPIDGKLKVGVSSPSYISDGERGKASFDGRREGEPYLVHISNENADSYTEILNFAAKLDYNENRFNGNVVDFMISPDFIENNKEKLIQVLKAGLNMGVFEFQMNVISSETLIEAKKNPDKYLNLIVRVWGFSAYFTELSESYQDLLISRALKNEGK